MTSAWAQADNLNQVIIIGVTVQARRVKRQMPNYEISHGCNSHCDFWKSLPRCAERLP